MSLTIGTQLGSYVVTALLGKGGMGEVYRARDRKLKREVAIKVLSDEWSHSDDRVLRFQQEAEVLASLNHPNIGAIHDLQEEGNVRFLILELVEGHTLDDALKRGVLSLDETLNIARQIADALEAAHGKGVIHRDLKTANIKLTPEGRVKVLDFGLAKAMRDPEMAFSNAETAAGMTGAGTILGTLAYMSPEQVRGESLDGRSDIFSFGIVLYEMIAGRHPFAAATAADTIAAILTSRPLAIADALPMALRQVVSKCLEKDKTRRYQTAPEILVQLNSIRTRLEGLPIQTGARAPIPLPPFLARTMDSTAFVGRENERRSMVEAWDGSKNGKRRVILVAGEPGIGKTRLCAEFARQCGEENATVLVGRSDEHALIPYQPFIEALGWYVRTCPEAELLAHLSAIGGGAELGPLLPDLVRRVPELPVLAPMNPEGQRFRLFEAVSTLLAAMSASRPTLVVFDDLHWADQPSLLMLRHIARSSESARLCIVGNYRESEVTLRHPLAEMLADLRSHPWVTRIVLPGLSATQVSDLVGSFAGSDPPRSLVQAVAENSGGNPFFIGEILRHLMETGALAVLRDASAVRSSDLGVPDGVRDVIRQRLSRLSEDCNRMLTLAAMIGQEFNLTLIEALSGLSEDRLLEVIEEAIRAQLVAEVRDGRDRCRFVHALIRETLYEELSGPRRSRWHRKIGEAIEQLTTHDPPLADLAYHFAEAAGTGVIDKAVEYAIRAGDHATATLAHEEAARFYEMALRSLEAAPTGPETSARRLDIHTRRGHVFAAIAQWLPARQEFERALENASEKQIDRRCELLLGIFESSFWLGHEVASVDRLALEALSLAEQLPDRGDLAADAMAGSARCKIVSGDIPGAIALNRRAILSAGGHRTMAHAFGPLPLYLAGLSAEAIAIGTEASRIAPTSQDTKFTIFALPHFAISLAAVGRYREAKDVFKEARAFGRRYGVVGPLARVISFESGLHMSIFDFKGAEELQRESRELAGGAGFLQPFISSGIDMLLMFARSRNPGPAEALMKETANAAATNPWHKNLWRVRLSQARTELALARGDRNTTIEEAFTAMDQARVLGRPKYEALAHIARAHALGGLDRMPEAVADANRAIALARRTADPALLLQALDMLLVLDGNDEALAEARALVGRIVSALPNDTMLQTFQASEIVRRVQKL